MKPQLTRREVMVAGGVGVAGTVVATTADQATAVPSVAGDAATRQQELRVLEGLLQTERMLQYAYGRVLKSWSFSSSTRDVLELILGHEGEHEAALQGPIADLASGLSASARAAATPTNAASPRAAVVTLLNGAQTPRDAVRVLTKVESLSQSRYFNAVGELQSSSLVLTAAQILASEAQHWSLLLNALTEGDMPQVVPTPFVRGVGDLSTG